VRHEHGTHTFVFRFEIARRQFNGFRSDSSRPRSLSSPDSQNDAITNLRLGLPYSMVIAVGDLSAGFRSWEMSYYAGDTWRAGLEPHPQLWASLPTQPGAQMKSTIPALSLRLRLQQSGAQVGIAYRFPVPPACCGRATGLQYGPILPSSYA